MKVVKLTDQQVETLKAALRTDYRNVEALGALPIGAELEAEIRSAHDALNQSEPLLDTEDVEAIALTVVAKCKPTMRYVIGDVTPSQYDRADRMAVGIKNAVITALSEIGLYEPEAEDARTG
jgi:hypothetical protein